MWVVVLFCVWTNLSKIEESTIKSVSNVNASAAKGDLVDHADEVQGEECQS